MKTKAVGGWFRAHPRILSYRTFFYILLVLAAWHLLGDGLAAVRLREKLTSTDCRFDSFSEPAVALAILRQHVANLGNSCAAHQERARAAALAAMRQHDAGRGASGGALVQAAAVPNRSGAPDSTLQGMLEMDKRIHELEMDLEANLMAIYYQTAMWSELLDCYLEVLQVAPESPFLVSWSGAALEAARHCQRVGELVDAVQDVIRFHPELKSARAFQDLLQAWGPVNLLGAG